MQDEVIEVEESLWYDHEFGCYTEGNKRTRKADVGWNWIAIQFDHGEQVTAVYAMKKQVFKGLISLPLTKRGNNNHLMIFSQPLRIISVGPRFEPLMNTLPIGS